MLTSIMTFDVYILTILDPFFMGVLNFVTGVCVLCAQSPLSQSHLSHQKSIALQNCVETNLRAQWSSETRARLTTFGPTIDSNMQALAFSNRLRTEPSLSLCD